MAATPVRRAVELDSSRIDPLEALRLWRTKTNIVRLRSNCVMRCMKSGRDH
jgi:hypothetical protein